MDGKKYIKTKKDDEQHINPKLQDMAKQKNMFLMG